MRYLFRSIAVLMLLAFAAAVQPPTLPAQALLDVPSVVVSVATPAAALHALQLPDSVTVPVGDTTTSFVIPAACFADVVACAGKAFLANQTALIMLITTLLLGVLAKIPAFAGLGDGLKIITHFVAQFGISWIAMLLAHTPNALVAALASAGLGSLVSYFVFQNGKNQPSTASEARAASLRAAST
jgi:hypothetical protein